MTFVLDSALKSTMILAVAWLITAVMRRRSADVRHLVWLAAILASVTLPLMAVLLPKSWPAIHLAASAQIVSGPERAVRSAAAFPWLLIVWAAGAAFVLLRLIAGIVQIARVTRRAVMRDGIYYSDEIATPLTWGFFRPAIVLPAGMSGDIVIRHEQAHIERNDWLWQTIARAVTALYWFHPLVWLADAMLRREAEQAVDDRVLASGVDAGEYAEQLVAVARNLIGAAPAQSVAMVRTAALEGRVRSILDRTRSRVRAGWLVRAAIAAGTAALIVPLAAFQDPTVHKIGEKGVKPPRVISKVDPKYTAEARDAKIEGTVVLRCLVDEGGVAENIEVVRSLDSGLDTEAISAVSQWRFAPATKDDKPVRVEATIEVNFRLL